MKNQADQKAGARAPAVRNPLVQPLRVLGPAAHGASLLATLFALWLMLSGHFDNLLLYLGFASSALVVWLSARMSLVDEEGHPIHLSWRMPGYLLWLAGEIVKANLDVAWRIASPRLRIDPAVSTVPADQASDLGKLIYANSITLTPGTVSAHLESGAIHVHALTAAALEALQEGEMARRVNTLEHGT